MEDERLSYLIAVYLDRSIAPAKKRELDRALQESEAARRQFWQQASLHGLSYNAAKTQFANQLDAVPDLDVAAETVPDNPPVRSAAQSVGNFFNWLRDWRLALATAGLAVAAVAVWFQFQPVPTPTLSPSVVTSQTVLPEQDDAEATKTVAVVLRAWSLVTDGTNATPEAGATLSAGQLELKAGILELGFLKGARVVVQGPAKLDLVSRQEVFLHYGRMSAVVPEQARGFKVNSAEVRLTDLGTEFGIYKPEGQPAEVHVFQGKVIVSSPTDGQQTRELTKGRGGVFSSGQVRDIHADPSAFVNEQEVARRAAQEMRIRYESWKQATSLLDEDPAALVHYSFEAQPNSDLEVRNGVRSPAPETQGSLIGCSWSEGRWPQKGALEFRRQSDRVRLGVPGAFRSLSYLAWVRVDSLPNQLNALALTESVQQGEVHWQITREGRLWLAVRWRAGGGDPNWEVSQTSPVITPERFGRWLLLASVYDGDARMVRHYVNGQVIAAKPIEHPGTLVLGALEVGNWGARIEKPQFAQISNIGDERYRTRNFVGRMDEFALFSRALTEDEIAQIYDQGRPAASGMKLALANQPR